MVVGGGAAGLVAAWRAAVCGACVTLVEKTDRLGTKLLISGGGKCNITHDCTVEELLAAFRTAEARFLRPAAFRFTAAGVLEMLARHGVSTYTRPDGRVFPRDGTARDVVAALATCLQERGVAVRYATPVTGLLVLDGAVAGVQTRDGTLHTRAVVVAAGGSSYPATGSTGDGWHWARALGHTIAPVRAALAPVYLDPTPPVEWAGVALRGCVVATRQAGRRFARQPGDVLFTHRGISGPAVLAISREVAERCETGAVQVEVDLAGAETEEQLTGRLLEEAAAAPRRKIAALIEGFVPHRLAPAVLSAARVDGSVTGAQLTREARARLVATLKAWPLGMVRAVPLEKGEVVAGGVALPEVDPHTMRSRLVGGLYLCGELLDIAGPVGGYNLQAAFSTGYVAGEAAALGW